MTTKARFYYRSDGSIIFEVKTDCDPIAVLDKLAGIASGLLGKVIVDARYEDTEGADQPRCDEATTATPETFTKDEIRSACNRVGAAYWADLILSHLQISPR